MQNHFPTVEKKEKVLVPICQSLSEDKDKAKLLRRKKRVKVDGKPGVAALTVKSGEGRTCSFRPLGEEH